MGSADGSDREVQNRWGLDGGPNGEDRPHRSGGQDKTPLLQEERVAEDFPHMLMGV